MIRTEKRKCTERAIYEAINPSTLEETMECARIINDYRQKCTNYDMMIELCEREEEIIISTLKALTRKEDAIKKFIKSGIVELLLTEDYGYVLAELMKGNPLGISFKGKEPYMLHFGYTFLRDFPDATVYIKGARKKFKLKNLKQEVESYNDELIAKIDIVNKLHNSICERKSILEKEGEHTLLSINGHCWNYKGEMFGCVIEHLIK